jgi:hypothetical protein
MLDPFDEAAAIDDIQFLPLALHFHASEILCEFADLFDDFDFGIAALIFENRQTSAMESLVRPITRSSPRRNPVVLKPFIPIDAAELYLSALKEIFRQRSGEGRSMERPAIEGAPPN